ncbi:MAG: hypothetical protein JSU87_01365 [Gemmatimonadota bacterium]|nr:MAG: hypothetical protein JSU87_01365 [Gemmatimonadota bacterium]
MDKEGSGGRLTPFEMVFGVERLAEEEFPAIAEEARARAITVERPSGFAQLERVAALLQRLLPENVEPGAFERYVEVAYHCFHFWKAGCPLLVLEAALIRDLVESPPDLRGWRIRSASPAYYLELPKNLFWAGIVGDAPPEPVEGIFLKLDPEDPAGEVRLLLVLGMRPQRYGFSAAGLAADLGRARDLDEPAAFRSDLPGADLAKLYSLSRNSEGLLLVLRLLWYLGMYPESLERVKAGSGAVTEDLDAATALDYCKVRLIERSRG